ncbi:TRI45-like protein [Mya arenaria]|uniref:TRI45-like protein n=1 Tax=Mya arenaria TaxID=6604 RepID=A0ABY7FTF7_MYAAR|nr:TRI45-like protein [Mya arenaria]
MSINIPRIHRLELHCQDCQQSLCVACLQQHNKFAGMRNHRLVSQQEHRSLTVTMETGSQEGEMFRCPQHEEKPLNMYCQECDFVTCSVCVATKHRDCSGIEFIPNISRDVRNSPLHIMVKEDFHFLKDQLEQIKTARGQNSKAIEVSCEGIEEQLRGLRDNFNKHLDDLEMDVHKELEERSSKLHKRFQTDMGRIEKMMYVVQVKINELENRTFSDAEAFINTKMAEKKAKTCKAFIRDITADLGKENLKFEPNEELIEFLHGASNLGVFVNNNTFHGSLVAAGIVVAKVECAAYFFVATKGSRKTLAKLNKYLQELENISLPDTPAGLAKVNDQELALGFETAKKIEIYQFQNELQISRTIDISCEYIGMACFKEEIYLTAKGKLFDVPDLHIFEMNEKKNTIIKVEKDSMKPFFTSPTDIAVHPELEYIYICDDKRGLVCLERDGTLVSVATHPDLRRPRGVHVTSQGQVFVCGNRSNTVFQLEADNETLKAILNEKHGIKSPQGLCFHTQKSRLFVMSGTDTVQVFNIN